MQHNHSPLKGLNNLMAASLLYNIALLLFFTILMLIIQEWYMLVMLLFIDKTCVTTPDKKTDNFGD